MGEGGNEKRLLPVWLLKPLYISAIGYLTKNVLLSSHQELSRKDYEEKKELVADEIIRRLESKLFPGLKSSVVFKEVMYVSSS